MALRLQHTYGEPDHRYLSPAATVDGDEVLRRVCKDECRDQEDPHDGGSVPMLPGNIGGSGSTEV